MNLPSSHHRLGLLAAESYMGLTSQEGLVQRCPLHLLDVGTDKH